MDKILGKLLDTGFGRNLIAAMFASLVLAVSALSAYVIVQAGEIRSTNASLVKCANEWKDDRERLLRQQIEQHITTSQRIDALEKKRKR